MLVEGQGARRYRSRNPVLQPTLKVRLDRQPFWRRGDTLGCNLTTFLELADDLGPGPSVDCLSYTLPLAPAEVDRADPDAVFPLVDRTFSVARPT